jgi:hypothetical protein
VHTEYGREDYNANHIFFCALTALAGCSDDKSDTASHLPVCAGNSIEVEVCIDCDDAGDCEETGLECRSICDADEDCQDTHECTSSDEGMYCAQRDQCD